MTEKDTRPRAGQAYRYTLDPADMVKCQSCIGALGWVSPEPSSGIPGWPCPDCAESPGLVVRLDDCTRCVTGLECEECGCTGKVPAAERVIEVTGEDNEVFNIWNWRVKGKPCGECGFRRDRGGSAHTQEAALAAAREVLSDG